MKLFSVIKILQLDVYSFIRENQNRYDKYTTKQYTD